MTVSQPLFGLCVYDGLDFCGALLYYGTYQPVIFEVLASSLEADV